MVTNIEVFKADAVVRELRPVLAQIWETHDIESIVLALQYLCAVGITNSSDLTIIQKSALIRKAKKQLQEFASSLQEGTSNSSSPN